MNYLLKISLFIVLIALTHSSFGQSEHKEIDDLIIKATGLAKQDPANAESLFKKAIELSEEANYNIGLARCNYRLGNLYEDQENFSKAQKHLFQALKLFEKDEVDRTDEIVSCKVSIGSVFYHTKKFDDALEYSYELLDYYKSIKDSTRISLIYSNLNAIYSYTADTIKALKTGKLALKFFDGKDSSFYGTTLMNVATNFYDMGDLDSAYILTNKALEVYESLNNLEGVGNQYFMLGLISETQGNINIAITFYHKSLDISEQLNFTDLKRSNLEGLMLSHAILGNSDSVYYYYDQLSFVQEAITEQIHDKTIKELQIQYETEKQEEESKRLKTENAFKDERIESGRKTIILLIVSIVLVLVITLVIIVYLRQKQILAKLELQQKNDEVMRIMKEQEVLAYEAQLEGESLERNRVARELHDRVGGLLATINLHCESLRTNMEMLRIDQMQDLLKETISEVRTISHNLEGDMETSGLKSTLEHLRNAIDSSGRIKFGLYYELGEYKPPLSLSREIVKIIQELVTNTIKHAEAKEITAQLSNPGDHLQIIYEDDGKGFQVDPSQHGIGMKNIQQRVDTVKGKWNIDSQPGYGTTVVIEIPLRA